jgi:N-acetylmuramoyl-L-alanine amidase
LAFKIAIDAGHGLKTPGKRIPKALDASQTREWTLNDRVARYIAEAAKQYEDVETLRVDDVTGKKDVSLSARCKASNNWGADMYISCHHNAGIKLGTGGGIVAFCLKLGTKAAEYRDEIYKACIADGGLKGNRSNPTPETGYYVLKNTKAPAVLMEYGFMDSQTDVPFIMQDKYSKLVGYATMEGIAKVAGLKKKSAPAKQETDKPASVKVDSAKSYNALKAGKYIVNTKSLNLRCGASTNKQIIEAMAKGTIFTCYGYYTGSWLYGISASGKKGFCHKSYLKKK